ncbi:MAG: metal-dependent transcriptional regulator [Hyphomicrobiaceae bacterium]
MTPIGEQYLAAVLVLQLDGAHGPIRTSDISKKMEKHAGSVTHMIQRLAESGFVSYEPSHGVKLLPPGRVIALRWLRRQRMLKKFLGEALGFDWAEVTGEAQRLADSASATLIDRIEVRLGYPRFDPHGDPIPDREGNLPDCHDVQLATLREGSCFVVTRIVDQSPQFLRYLTSEGVAIGTTGTLIEHDLQGDTIRTRIASRPLVFARAVAGKIAVTLS